MSSLEIKKRFQGSERYMGPKDKGHSQDRNAGGEMMHFAGDDKDHNPNNKSMVMLNNHSSIRGGQSQGEYLNYNAHSNNSHHAKVYTRLPWNNAPGEGYGGHNNVSQKNIRVPQNFSTGEGGAIFNVYSGEKNLNCGC
jgi:hypothetical protein